MKTECGWKIIADKESETEGGFSTVTLSLIAETEEDAVSIVRAALKSPATRITITTEDRHIRDGRRNAGLDGRVMIAGEPGWRHATG